MYPILWKNHELQQEAPEEQPHSSAEKPCLVLGGQTQTRSWGSISSAALTVWINTEFVPFCLHVEESFIVVIGFSLANDQQALGNELGSVRARGAWATSRNTRPRAGTTPVCPYGATGKDCTVPGILPASNQTVHQVPAFPTGRPEGSSIWGSAFPNTTATGARGGQWPQEPCTSPRWRQGGAKIPHLVISPFRGAKISVCNLSSKSLPDLNTSAKKSESSYCS